MKNNAQIQRKAMKNIVASAVSNRINGEENAPTVPEALTNPKVRDRTLEGNNSAI
jgi:hypothetical protein